MAKTFEVYTIKASLVMARIAGIESTAKIKSVVSMSNRTINKGVAVRFPFSRIQNLLP